MNNFPYGCGMNEFLRKGKVRNASSYCRNSQTFWNNLEVCKFLLKASICQCFVAVYDLSPVTCN